jgi:hypothetical protein
VLLELTARALALVFSAVARQSPDESGRIPSPRGAVQSDNESRSLPELDILTVEYLLRPLYCFLVIVAFDNTRRRGDRAVGTECIDAVM